MPQIDLPGAVAALLEAQQAIAELRGRPVAELPGPPPTDRWGPDLLGRGFRARTLPLAADEEGDVAATLVRYDGPRSLRRPRFAVLYLHGWNDYFFHPHVADFWRSLGGAFYALDLRKYGRSLRLGQSPGYVRDLAEYDEDLAAALAVVREERGADLPLVLAAHSTGGLVATLWADRNPGQTVALVLNSPWLEIQGAQVVRNLSRPVIEHLARQHPMTEVPFVDPGHYARATDSGLEGEWVIDRRWRPAYSPPVRAGWLSAILEGHARVAAGLTIDASVLVLTSARSMINPVWSEEMRRSDIVLDVESLGRRALHLGSVVTVARVEGAMHDVFLSAPPVRERAFEVVRRWGRAYLAD